MMFDNDDLNKTFQELIENTNLANGYLEPVLEKLNQETTEIEAIDVAQIAKSIDHLIISNARIQALLLALAGIAKSQK